MKAVEFCCGYGGATAGLLANGLEVEAAYDIWPVAVEAHKRWHVDSPASVRDVATVQPEELTGRFVWASLPCQPWSVANRSTKRGKNHPHYYSLAYFARQVQHAAVAVFENVPGLVSQPHGREELKEFEAECLRLGLPWSMHIIESSWYGVPQTRRRLIIVIGNAMVVFPKGEIKGKLFPAPTATEHKGSFRRVGKEGAVVRGDRVSYPSRPPELCAQLQGVPHEPIAHLPKRDQYILIGNAVPPLLATAVVKHVLNGLSLPAPDPS